MLLDTQSEPRTETVSRRNIIINYHRICKARASYCAILVPGLVSVWHWFCSASGAAIQELFEYCYLFGHSPVLCQILLACCSFAIHIYDFFAHPLNGHERYFNS